MAAVDTNGNIITKGCKLAICSVGDSTRGPGIHVKSCTVTDVVGHKVYLDNEETPTLSAANALIMPRQMSDDEYMLVYRAWLELGQIPFNEIPKQVADTISSQRNALATVLRESYYTIEEAMEARGL